MSSVRTVERQDPRVPAGLHEEDVPILSETCHRRGALNGGECALGYESGQAASPRCALP